MRTIPIYQLKITRRLLELGFRIHDINTNKNGSGNLVFFFYKEDGIKEVLKNEFNVKIN